MLEAKTGMAAVSMAGHDTGRFYIIIKADDEYVYLVDGKLRTLDRPKKKKRKHVQIHRRIHPDLQDILEKGGELKDETIKRVIKNYRSKQEV